MMNWIKWIGILCLAAIAGTFLWPLQTSQASFSEPPKGLPESIGFGNGVRIYPQSPQSDQAMRAAISMGFNWVGIEFDWAVIWPEMTLPPDLSTFTHLIDLAKQHHMPILVSITHAPDWALSANGPDPAMTVTLLDYLAAQYSEAIMAVELFPEANTRAGWGAAPNPQAYVQLLRMASDQWHAKGISITLVAGGLITQSDLPSPDDWNDIDFLESLYLFDAADVMPIVSLHFTHLTASPVTYWSQDNRDALRKYEVIRQVMKSYDHFNGLLWITAFRWNADIMNVQDAQKSSWLTDSFTQMSTQIYLGAAFYDAFNTPLADSSNSNSLCCTDKPAQKLLSYLAVNQSKNFSINQLRKGLLKKEISSQSRHGSTLSHLTLFSNYRHFQFGIWRDFGFIPGS